MGGTSHIADGTEKKTPMMHQSEYFNYTIDSFNSDAGAIPLYILEMPYKGKNASMILFMPEANHDLSLLEKEMNEANLQKWISALSNKRNKIHVVIPKFKMSLSYFLNDNLKNMGIKNAFEENLADFTGIAPTKLFISLVAHKAYIEVDEEGTTAVAATVVRVSASAVTNDFIADHPFIFIIRENTTGSILFMGRVMDPTEKDES